MDDSLDLLSKTKYVKIVKPINRSFSSELKIIGNVLANKQVSIHSMEGGNISELYHIHFAGIIPSIGLN